MANLEAIILDLDGVITKTAKLHALAWKSMFDQFIENYNQKHHQQISTFNILVDYPKYIDGIPRYDGVRNFLKSRELRLPDGHSEDAPNEESVCGLGNRKNIVFNKLLEDKGIEVYEGTLNKIDEWKSSGLKIGVISSSKNCRPILISAGLISLFDTIVDGVDSAEQNIKGKPEPDIFYKAAENMNVLPENCFVVEDAILGVKAGQRGGFMKVIGIDRSGNKEELYKNGADLVVESLNDLK